MTAPVQAKGGYTRFPQSYEYGASRLSPSYRGDTGKTKIRKFARIQHLHAYGHETQVGL